MKTTLYPKYLFRRLFVRGKNRFYSAGYKCIYPECSTYGMTPWQHYVIDGQRKGYDNGNLPPDTVFFREGYELEYPDIKAFGDDAWHHFAENGLSEGRDNGLHPNGDLFFTEGYLEMYPDVAESGIDPWHHYVLQGKKEGRDNGLHPADDRFFADGYCEMYPDVAGSGIDPWHHYVLQGKKEGRDNGLHPDDQKFFAAGYLEMYKDVAESGMEPWRHYVLQGKNEGRDNGIHPDEHKFFSAGYLEMYQDVAEGGMDPWHHYVLLGKKEDRDNGLHPGEDEFFADGYLAMYSDVMENGIEPWHHYVQKGKKEGRDNGLHPAEQEFFAAGYLEMYPYIAEGGIDPWHQYVLYGKKKGHDNGLHPKNDVFFPEGYIVMYPDVAHRGDDPWKHFVHDGIKEGRDNGLHPNDDLFFAAGYAEMYPDVAKSGLDPWHHYVLRGKQEGRDNGQHPGQELFFREGYLEMYPYVADSGVDPWHHYVLYGRKDGRDNGLHPEDQKFFPEGYLAMYPDVAQRGENPWRHYVLNGIKEGRDNGLHPNEELFFAAGYAEMYPDAAKSGMDPWHHYVLKGRKEGRDNGRAGVDPGFYLSLYFDVGESGINPIIHYIKYGKQEGRVPNPEALNMKKEELDLIRNSAYFDKEWYLREYPWICLDPVIDYYAHFNERNPSISFISKDYCRMNPDVQKTGINPLVHFERYGKFLNRPTMLSYKQTEKFSGNLTEFEEINNKKLHAVNGEQPLHNKVLVFAASCQDGRLHGFRQNLVHELRQYCDYLVFVSDRPVSEDEIKVSQDIDAFICRKHYRTYFGSYVYGIELLSKLGFLDGVNDLILCNDSCFGPINSFAPVFRKYDQDKSQIDFYGLAVSDDYKTHSFIHPYFLIFAQAVYQSEIFREEFSLAHVPDGIYPADVDVNVAGELTFKLAQAGFVYKTFVDQDDFTRKYGDAQPADKPLNLLAGYGYPLIHRSYFILNKDTANYVQLVEYLKNGKSGFWKSVSGEVEAELGNAGTVVRDAAYRPVDYSFSGVRKHYASLLPKIQQRVKKRGFIKVDFLVANLSMFACRSLIDKMLRDPRFRARIIIIPDIRWTKADTLKEYRKCVRELTGIYGQDIVSQSVLNPESKYPVLTDIFDSKPDVVFYPMPYDLSLTPYNIPYAVRSNVLPAYINYTFPCNKYCEDVFRGINYSNLWMVFLETQFQLNNYKQNGYVNGDNAVVAGYSKMDELYDITRSIDRIKSHTYNGKIYERIIIIAPHHSLKGGYNSTMHLANFLKYAEFFQELPKNFSNILFVFRPHPALFPLLKQDNFWGEKRLEEYLKRLQENNNVVLSEEGNYFYWFAASDAMIHDCASFTVEYLYTGKPCCYMLKSESEVGEIFDDFGKQCLDCHYHAFNEKDIVKFIEEEVLKGHDSKRNIRTKFTHEALLKDYPRSSEKIMNYLVDNLMN